MKSVLLITQYYYPSSAAGHHRVAKLGKYLPQFGWNPVVLCGRTTRENSAGDYDPLLENSDTCETVRVSWPLRKSIFTPPGMLNYFLVSRLDPTRNPLWSYNALKKQALELLRSRHFDAIWATSPFLPPLRVADYVSRKTGVPWVADLRDIIHELVAEPNMLQRWQINQETKLCRSASSIITVTQPLADILAARHKVPVHVVSNGFDADDFPPAAPQPGEYFDIVYCGWLYGGRDPSNLFTALDTMLAQGEKLDKLRVPMYCVTEEELKPYLQGRRCASLVQPRARLSLAEVLKVEQRAAVLLLLSHANAIGIMPYKTFEYLGARRPILSVPGDHSVTDALLDETQAGVVGRTPEDVARQIRSWYAEWQETGSVAYRGLDSKINQYTRKRQAEQTAPILDSALKLTGKSN